MASRSGIKAKIAALRAKTTSAGCTEAEAMAAAAVAAELMQRHGLDEADIAMAEAVAYDPVSAPTWRTTLSTIIAYCTNTASIVVDDKRCGGVAVMFIGRDPGPEIAVYLRDVCFRAVEAEVKAFRASTFYRRRRTVATRRLAAADFRKGLVDRLCVRLVDLFGPTIDDAARAESRQALQGRFMGCVTIAAPEHKERFSAATNAGWVAGNAVPLHRGVATPDLKQITGGTS